MVHCDLLLTNALIVTMDEQFTIHQRGGLAIAGDTIVSVGPDAMKGKPGAGGGSGTTQQQQPQREHERGGQPGGQPQPQPQGQR